MKITLLTTLMVLAGFAVSTQSQAQAIFDVGPRGGLDIDAIDKPFIGADVRVSLASLPVIINPAFDYYFVEGDDSIYQISGNVLYPFGINNQVFTPYSGLGVGIGRFQREIDGFEDQSETDFGLNVVGGAVFGFGTLRPFVQAQLTLLGDTDFTTLGGGVLFRVGGQ